MNISNTNDICAALLYPQQLDKLCLVQKPKVLEMLAGVDTTKQELYRDIVNRNFDHSMKSTSIILGF